MALNIGTINFNLDANTRGLQNAVKQIEQFRKVVNAAARDTEKGSGATLNAYARQESATKRAFQQTLNLQRAIRSNVLDEQKRNQMLANSTNAFRIFVKEMTSGVLKTHEFNRATDAFNARLNRSSREVKNLKDNKLASTLGAWGLKFRELESSAVLAMGPLSGIGARFRALSALMTRSGSIMTTVYIGGLVLLTTALYKAAAAAVKTSMEIERLQARFRAAAGGDAVKGAKDFQFVTSTAEQLGLKITDLAKSYSRLSAATAGTVLKGEQAENIFVAVSEAAAALRLESTEVEGAFRAIEQMVSKGNVQAEELRGQLGERLPGAFQMAAKAMGVTTRELDRMLRRGEITATDMLPKLAKVMHETFGGEAATNIHSMQGAVNRLSNAFTDLKLAFASTTGAANLYEQAIELAIDFTKGLTRYIDLVKVPAMVLLSVFWSLLLSIKGLKAAAQLSFGFIANAIAAMIEGAVKLGNALKDAFYVDTDELKARIDDIREKMAGNISQTAREKLGADLKRLLAEYEEQTGKAAPQMFQVPEVVDDLRALGRVANDELTRTVDDIKAFGSESPFTRWWQDLGTYKGLLGETVPLWKDLLDPDTLNVSAAFDNLINKITDMRSETEGYRVAMSAAAGMTDMTSIDAMVDAVQEIRKLGTHNDDIEELAAFFGVAADDTEALRAALAGVFEENARITAEMQRWKRAQERMPEIAREIADEFGRVTTAINMARFGPQFQEMAATMAEISRKAETMRDKLEQGNFTPEQIEGVITAYRELLILQDEEAKKAARFADLSEDFANRIGQAFTDAIFEGEKLSDVLKNLLKDLVKIAFQQAVMQPFTDALSGMFGFMMGGGIPGQTAGGTFKNIFKGKMFAKGGVTDGPTSFINGGKGLGMAGESGKEAILPLGRTSSGDLGVQVAGGGTSGAPPVYVTQHIHFDVGLESVDERIMAAAPQIASSAQIGIQKAMRRPSMA